MIFCSQQIQEPFLLVPTRWMEMKVGRGWKIHSNIWMVAKPNGPSANIGWINNELSKGTCKTTFRSFHCTCTFKLFIIAHDNRLNNSADIRAQSLWRRPEPLSVHQPNNWDLFIFSYHVSFVSKKSYDEVSTVTKSGWDTVANFFSLFPKSQMSLKF